ncbi:penicillin-binding protein activator [Halomonas sp. HP20-15]|uniref:penicillin-binding protein activator n=1 Tax=Halomonas sp. HP20-15 TaxID=3085901 RepID=UPI002980CBA5|nr:penicillin-binding protein activator [Halomonas sp. HP20-15]MDW5378654.1 penicillin-binding protein activator [Halomonas sp. HP20-15]
MDKSLRRLCGVGLVALVMSGCASQRSPMEGIRGQQAPGELLSQAEQQSGAQAAQTRLQAADILARRGDTAQALQVAVGIDAAALPSEARVQWALLLSQLGLEQQDGRSVMKATELLNGNVPLSRDAEFTLRHRRGLAQGMVGDPQAAASTLIALQAAQAPFDLNDDIWRQLTRLRGPSLQAVAQQSQLARGWVDLLRLQRRYGSDIARLFAMLDDWRAQNPNHPAARRLPADLQALRELRGQDVRRIAVFLPESGPLENVAAALRKGIETRHMNALDQGEQTPQLTFYDTSGASIETLYAQATLAGAQVVLGPLSKDTVTELEQRPSVPLPTLALNYGTSPSNRADDLFQYGLSAEDEARQAAHRAALDGHQRAGMLVPDNAWGQRVAESFRQAWQSQGGTLAAQIDYDPEGSASKAVRPLANRQLDMLFLLALPPFARQVPPTLDYFNAGDLPIYATSHLYEGEPQPRLDHDLNGVQFVEIPWLIPEAAVGGVEALPYYDSYQALHDTTDPALLKLQAMGVDAFELARRLPLLRVAPNTEYFGATGALHAGADRRLERVLPWAQFKAGVPQPPLRGTQRAVLEPTEPAGGVSETAGGDAQPAP